MEIGASPNSDQLLPAPAPALITPKIPHPLPVTRQHSLNILIYSTVPSPYQRDLFRALAAEPGLGLRVAYFEKAAPDSPWPEPELEPFERVLRGGCLGRGRVRSHWHWTLPQSLPGERVVINAALTDLSTQWLMRRCRDWWFWGEVMREGHNGLAARVRRRLAAPLRRAAGIFAVGRSAAADYARRFNGVRVVNLPYHCRLDEFFAIDRESVQAGAGRDLRLLFCGQMIERKGIDVLLDAAARAVIERRAPLRLLLAGREDRIGERLAALPEGVRERIELVGFTPPDALPALFGRADALVLPSRHDGWGVVINQALAAGLPVIATSAVQAAVDLVEPGRGGWQVAPGDPGALLAAFNDACELHRGGRLAAMGSFNREHARSLTPEAGARLMRETLAGNQPAPGP